MKIYILATIVLGGLFLMGCESPSPSSERIRISEVPGKYIGNFGETDINYFELLADSIYVFYYMDSDDNMYVDSGEWEFDDISSKYGKGYVLIFPKFISRTKELCDTQEYFRIVDTTANGEIVTRHWGEFRKDDGVIRVYYCGEDTPYYKKVTDTKK